MSVSRYYQIELEKLRVESEKISIFTKHPGTLGSFREQLLKDYIRKFIPNFLSVNSGFVSDYRNADKDQIHQKQTRQIDLIIHDENYYTPFLKTFDFSIIEPESLYAAIEIKSKLTFHKVYGGKIKESTKSDKFPFDDGECYYCWGGTLIDAMENIRSISSLVNEYKQKVFYGIFAYDSNVNFHTLYNAFDNHEIQRQLNIKHIDELAPYICNLSGELAYFGRVSMFEDEIEGRFDESQTEITHIKVTNENAEFPLQFFTNALKINVDAFLTEKKPHKRGLYTAGLGEIEFWHNHFDLSSDYRKIDENQ